MVRGIVHRRKTYVQVTARFSEDGEVTPIAVTWSDGRVWRIDRVLDRRRAASLKVGGTGVRYLVEIGGKRTFLFYEDPAWFVEEKVVEMP